MPHMSDREPFRAPATEGVERSVLRLAFLLAGGFLVVASGAYLATARAEVRFVAEGNLWVEGPEGGMGYATSTGAGAVAAPGVWIELLRSYQVLEPVVLDRRLYLRPPEGQRAAFASFALAKGYVPGDYELRIGDAGGDFALFDRQGTLIQQGTLGSPIGRGLGFDWTPSPTSFAPGATIAFSVLSVRDAARELSERLSVRSEREGRFVRIALEGSDPQVATDVVNAVMQQGVAFDRRLKRTGLDEAVTSLERQMAAAQRQLEEAERDLEGHRFDAIGAASSRPPSTAERTAEARLRRQVRIAESLYNELRAQVETARLDAARSAPVLHILDRASIRVR